MFASLLRLRHRPLAAFVGALVTLVVNDHVLKPAAAHGAPIPHVVTGKLSDVAGMVVACCTIVWLLGARSPATVAAVASLCGGFAAINLFPDASSWTEALFAACGLPWRLWPDPTDLVAFAVLPLALRVAWSALRDERRDTATLRLLAAAGAIACLGSGLFAPPPGEGSFQDGAYVVNDTDASQVVEVSKLRGTLDCRHDPRDLVGWVEDRDFVPATSHIVEPRGVLPLDVQDCVLVRLRSGGVTVLVAGEAFPQFLPRILDDDAPQPRRSLVHLTSTDGGVEFVAGPGLTIGQTRPPWQNEGASACPQVDVAPVQVRVPDVLVRGVIDRIEPLGQLCFEVGVSTSAQNDSSRAPAPDEFDPEPDAGVDGALDAGVGERDGGVASSWVDEIDAATPHDANVADSPPLLDPTPISTPTFTELLLCMPRTLFPFSVGDEVRASATSIGSAVGDTPRVRFSAGGEPATNVLPDSCGVVRDECGAYWQPLTLFSSGSLAIAGEVVTDGSVTRYLHVAERVRIAHQGCRSPLTQLGDRLVWTEVVR